MLAAAVAVVAACAARSAGKLAQGFCRDTLFGVAASSVHVVVSGVSVAFVAYMMVVMDVTVALRVRG